MRPKGEALAWGLFAGITLFGWAASFAIRGTGLESAEWEGIRDSDEPDVSGDEEQPVGP